MKKFAFILAAVATLSSNGAYAQSGPTGSAAQAGTMCTDSFAWGAAAASIVAVGVVVGLTVASATSNSSFSH